MNAQKYKDILQNVLSSVERIELPSDYIFK